MVFAASLSFAASPALGHGKFPKGGVRCDDENPELCAAEMLPGDIAPFHGLLINHKLAASLFSKSNSCDKRIQAAVTYTSSVAAEKTRYLMQNCSIEVSALVQERDLWKEEAGRTQPSFYEKPIFAIPVTAAVVAVLAFFLRR